MNECVICKKEIKSYDTQYINGKYYHNSCIENLQFKIDKARKIIDRYSRVVDYDDEVSVDVLHEIDDALREEINDI